MLEPDTDVCNGYSLALAADIAGSTVETKAADLDLEMAVDPQCRATSTLTAFWCSRLSDLRIDDMCALIVAQSVLKMLCFACG